MESGAEARKPGALRAKAPLVEPPRLPRFVAGVDGLAGTILRGWAIDLRDPRAPVTLVLEASGEPVLAFATHQHRVDFGEVLKDNVAGFALDLKALPAGAAAKIVAALGAAK